MQCDDIRRLPGRDGSHSSHKFSIGAVPLYQRILHYFDQGLWQIDAARLPIHRRLGLFTLRLLYALQRDLRGDAILVHATGLVYASLLSVVPLLAVSFSVLKGFGIHNTMEPMLLNLLEPLGDRAPELARNVISFVDNVKVRVLGSVGTVFLLYTVMSLVQKVESAFNAIWHQVGTRSLLRRFTDYLSVLLIGPVLVVSGLGIAASMANNQIVQDIIAIEPFGTLYYWLGLTVPYVLIIGAFAFVYKFIPNTRVETRAALLGGIIAGLTWKAAGGVFAVFVASSTQYDVIYSGFAIVLVCMVWLYTNWIIVLVGAQIAFYIQHPNLMSPGMTLDRIYASLPAEALLLVTQVLVSNFKECRPALQEDRLATATGLPPQLVRNILERLLAAGLVAKTDAYPNSYVLSQPPDQVALARLLRLARESRPEDSYLVTSIHSDPVVKAILAKIEQGVDNAVAGKSWDDLAPGNASTAADQTGHIPVAAPRPSKV